MNLASLAEHFGDDDKARAFLEKMRWPDGPICPHCGVIGEAYRLEPKSQTRTHVRKGVWKCGACREQFTVTVGTIFEDSHIPLHKWLLAIHLVCASKKGMSAHQLHRMLGVTYKSAWFMAHRIRYAMAEKPTGGKLSGPQNTVQADETFIGGKEKGVLGVRGIDQSKKTPVVALIERKGRVRSFAVEKVTAKNLKPILLANISENANLTTDESKVYQFARRNFKSHHTVNHVRKEYFRRHFDGIEVTTNDAETFFSLLKRGIYGVYHHVGRQHLHRYLSEFDFRYNARDMEDGDRSLLAIKATEGKRLTYKKPAEAATV